MGTWSDHNGRPTEVSVVADQGTAPPRTAALSERRRRPSAVRRDPAGWQARGGPVGPARPGPPWAGYRPSGPRGQPAATIPSPPWAPSSSPSVVGLSRRPFVRSSCPGACLLASWLAGYGGGVGLLQPNPRLASHALDARALATGPVDEHGTRSVCSGTRSSSQGE